MAREIDPHNLDADDAAYLRDRPWKIEEFERQGLTEEMAAVRAGEVQREDPAEFSKISTSEMSRGEFGEGIRESAPADGVTSGSQDEIVDDNYEEWTVEELKADIDERNKEEGRKVALSKQGTKADLAARLHEDDQAV